MRHISISRAVLRVFGCLALLIPGAIRLSGQDCPVDEKYAYTFCYHDESGSHVVTRCSSDPYHTFDEQGHLLTPFKRPIPGCIVIEEPRRTNIWMPQSVAGSEADTIPVFYFGDQFADIFDAFNQWGRLCPPSGDGPDCCVKIYFVHRTQDWPYFDPTFPMVQEDRIYPSTCRTGCTDPNAQRIYINDMPDWLYGNPVPGLEGKITRSFYTGRMPPNVRFGCEAYSLYQVIECAAGRWFGMGEGDYPGCPHPFSVVENPLSEPNGPPMDLTADDICQFRKLYCDHAVGLGVEREQAATGTLSQNIPNPFSALTTIAFLLAAPAHVTVMIHDERGTLVETLLDESMTAGAHTIGFNGAGLPSGVYWYSLHLGGETRARRMILVK